MLIWSIAWVNESGDVGVGGAGEADVAVADLREPQSGSAPGGLADAGDVRDHLAADDGEATAAPNHALWRISWRRLIAVGASSFGHAVTTTVPCMNGWIEQT